MSRTERRDSHGRILHSDDLARPQCRRRPAAYWLAHLNQPDDARGVRALYARALRPRLYDELP